MRNLLPPKLRHYKGPTEKFHPYFMNITDAFEKVITVCHPTQLRNPQGSNVDIHSSKNLRYNTVL
jgi:hypothetical protein